MDRKVRGCLFCQCLLPVTLHRFKKLFNDVYEPRQIFPVSFTLNICPDHYTHQVFAIFIAGPPYSFLRMSNQAFLENMNNELA